MFIVYELWNPLTDRCFYVGKSNSNRSRLPDHLRQARYLAEGKPLTDHNPLKAGTINAIFKAGREPEYRIVFQSDSEDEVLKKEIELISNYGRRNKGTGFLTNLTDGGEGIRGWVLSNEARAARSLSSKGRVMSDETKEKMRKAALGRRHTEETRRKISEIQTGKKRGPRSLETIEKIRKANLGTKRSEETLKKMSDARKGVPWTEARWAAQNGGTENF